MPDPDNSYDPLAVCLKQQGETIGYVSRAANAEIASRLDAGEPLAAYLPGLHPNAEPWQ
ncbi:hypothetical protein GWK36_13110 [Caldichromatium japonicum]|uniref:HIRAN domain-containing protein n=1 Tax=Caldichromatium japonicum TaxID=2699430 RepID=A0A6G7VFX0_9GAMM|nr:hypothetical protein [Caldichromatium japonicum]QIK38765.1 hypothetical protein GWK36_13110 [Caldichromatium japonicum]